MNTHVVQGALISSDASFRESVKQVLGGAEHGVELSVEITIACTEINAAQVEELRRVTLDLVLLDFELHRLTGKKTLLVDLDLDLGETVLLLGVEPRFSLIDVARNFHRMDAGLLESFVERHESGIHLLSASDHADRAEVPAEDQIRTILHFVKQHYAYVVVDACTSLTPSALAAFAEADRILVVTTLDLPSLRNLQRCLPLLERT